MRKPQILTKLRIDEVSCVVAGAGEGTRVLIQKNDGRTQRERLTNMFRAAGISKLETNRVPDEDPDDGDDVGDTDTKLSPQLEAHVAAMIVAVPTITRQHAIHYLLHSAHGRELLRTLATTKSQRGPPMKKDRATELRSIAKQYGVHKLAGLLVADGDAHGISEHELTSLAFEAAQKSAKPGERPNSAFARWYSEPAQLELRKAMRLAKNTPVDKAFPQLLDLKPVQVGGDDAVDTSVKDSSAKAYAQLTAMAEEMRRRTPELSAAQAFARIFEDTKNAELAAAAHKRPTPQDWKQMP